MLRTGSSGSYGTFLYDLLQDKKVLRQLFQPSDLENIPLFLLVQEAAQAPAATRGAGPVPGAGRDGPGPGLAPPPSWVRGPHGAH